MFFVTSLLFTQYVITYRAWLDVTLRMKLLVYETGNETETIYLKISWRSKFVLHPRYFYSLKPLRSDKFLRVFQDVCAYDSYVNAWFR